MTQLAVPGVDLAEAGPDDEIDGVAASSVATPTSTAEVAALLRAAAEHDLAVGVRGTGTKLGWGAPPRRLDLLLDLSGMDRVIEHSAGDLIVAVEAGLPIEALQEALAPSRQRLAIDPVTASRHPGTVGGVIATGATGPLRLASGGVRDLLIGITFVRADGIVAKSGGKVVKNVAGYDIGKLLTGSWGTLGVVTEAVFRLHPVPQAQRWVTVPAADAAEVGEAVQAVLHSQVVPSAVELDRPAGDGNDGAAELGVLLEGITDGVDDRVSALQELLGGGASSDSPPRWWGAAPWSGGDVVLRLTTEIARLPALLEGLDAACGELRRAAVRGSAGVGILHAALPGYDPGAVAAAVTDLRHRATAWGGDVVVLDAPGPVKRAVDVWGPARGLDLMRRVKDQFDPHHRLAPGRFVGGI